MLLVRDNFIVLYVDMWFDVPKCKFIVCISSIFVADTKIIFVYNFEAPFIFQTWTCGKLRPSKTPWISKNPRNDYDGFFFNNNLRHSAVNYCCKALHLWHLRNLGYTSEFSLISVLLMHTLVIKLKNNSTRYW